ncbi:STAS domain-containing protein [Naasia lichenicola]|uniref:STAS domain-containing protein n=1 Tax=Naasia lichenicola TaxID=2565933 RepID=A0A4S4FJ50_9MICO|nr:STAS domain-containing protein [Naasia lichenicola]THG30131.1 STAS domain-containing protein [Naasia lichenicola]
MSLQFALGTRGVVVVIHLLGRIDREAGGVLDQSYTAAAASSASIIELDFGQVEYINSTGIALIVGLLAKARAKKRPLRAAGLTAHYRHIFEITRLSDFIEIVEPIEPVEDVELEQAAH